MKRTIHFYGQGILSFIHTLDHDTIEKIEWTIALIRELDRLPNKYFKHLTGTKGIYEIRCQWLGNAVRLFCFFDAEKMVVIVHGVKKKSQKTPLKDIKLAEKLKNDYHEKKRKK